MTGAGEGGLGCKNGSVPTEREEGVPLQDPSKTFKMNPTETEMKTCDQCGGSYPEEDIVGCCRDGDCPHRFECMCRFCAVWHEEEEQWYCEKCETTPSEVECEGCGRPMAVCQDGEDCLCDECEEDESESETEEEEE